MEPPGSEPVGVVAQWQSIDMESQRPWVRTPLVAKTDFKTKKTVKDMLMNKREDSGIVC